MILFSALPGHSFCLHELNSNKTLLQLKTPPNSNYVLSNDPEELPPRKSVACLSSTNSLGTTVVSISGRDARNGILVWSTLAGKPTPSHRLIPPARVSVLSLSPAGTYLATGSPDGVVTLWELSTGTLLATFDAHYKSVTCLAFSDDEAALVTASLDSTCSVWSIPTLIDEAFNSNLSQTPYSIFSDHTLPILDVFISRGTFPDLRIFTASLDQTIKIWSPLYPDSPLLSTFAVPGPAHHLVVDPLERFIIVSYGSVLKEEGEKDGKDDVSKTEEGKKTTASAVRMIPLYARPTHGSSQGGISRVHASAGLVQPTHSTGGQEDIVYTSPSSTQITALHLPSSISNAILLCGLSTGKIVHLSLHSLQPLGQTVPHRPHEASSDPVVCITTFLRPPDLLSDPAHTVNSTGIAERPIGVLGRTVGKNGDNHRTNSQQQQQNPKQDLTSWIKFQDSQAIEDEDDPFCLPGLKKNQQQYVNLIHLNNNKINTHSDLIHRLTEESNQLKLSLNQAEAFNDAMWTRIVDGTLQLKHTNHDQS